MGETRVLTGTCLCKSVSISVEGQLEHDPEACHCVQCRKQSGGFFIGLNVRKASLTIQGNEFVTWYRSSEKVERGFCSACGSLLFWKPDIEGYEWISIAAGLLDGPIGRTVSKHTFVSEKGDYYEIGGDASQHEQFWCVVCR